VLLASYLRLTLGKCNNVNNIWLPEAGMSFATVADVSDSNNNNNINRKCLTVLKNFVMEKFGGAEILTPGIRNQYPLKM
jgi:hypothetical protein